jgi:hypothetical protein
VCQVDVMGVKLMWPVLLHCQVIAVVVVGDGCICTRQTMSQLSNVTTHKHCSENAEC